MNSTLTSGLINEGRNEIVCLCFCVWVFGDLKLIFEKLINILHLFIKSQNFLKLFLQSWKIYLMKEDTYQGRKSSVNKMYVVCVYIPSVYFQCRCGYCGLQRPKLKKCSQCRLVRYCNLSCQKRDWIHHRGICIFIAAKQSIWCWICENGSFVASLFVVTNIFVVESWVFCQDDYVDIFVRKPFNGKKIHNDNCIIFNLPIRKCILNG